MKKYIGTKAVSATPAWRVDGKVYPKDGIEPNCMNREDGYKVVYEDGYESWLSKDLFERIYNSANTLVERMTMDSWYINNKIHSLRNFTLTDRFKELDGHTRGFLLAQLCLMEHYQDLLDKRNLRTYSNYQLSTLSCMSFGVVIELLKYGFAIRRSGWNGKGLWVIKQVPAHISEQIIPKMTSLPQSAKDLIMKGNKFIDYTSQCLIYNKNTGRADSWVPSISDVFAEDWEIVTE